jgi:tetratricopeptide (TPR) repeat protein
MKKAMELDPLSPAMQSFAGVTFRWARDYKASLAQFQKVNLLNPNFALNHERMSQLLAIVGNYDEAISEESKARLLAGEKQVQVIAKMDALRQMLAAEGARGYWEQELKLSQDNENPPEAYVHSFGLAIIYANLGDKDKSFDNLKNAFEERDTHMTELAIEPQFDTLRSDPRFGVLARRVGLLTH